MHSVQKKNLIILEMNARGRLGGLTGRSDHSNTVEENARLVNPNINVSRRNSRTGYYTPSKKKGLLSWIQSYVRGFFQGNYEDLSEILKDKKGNTTPTAVNISQEIHKLNLLETIGVDRYKLNPNKLDKFELANLIDKALQGMQTEIIAWQNKIKGVVKKLKTNKVAVVNSVGNYNDILKGLYPKLRKKMGRDEAINPLLVGTDIIGVGATDANGKLTTYSTRGNHYQFATTTPDGKDEGTSFTAPAFSVILTETMRNKNMTVDQALADLKANNPRKIDDQGNAYTYIPLPKKK